MAATSLQNKTKLNLHARGAVPNIFINPFLRLRAKKLGIVVTSIRLASSNYLFIEAVGDKAKLWELVGWSKGHFKLFFALDTVNFDFEDFVR